MTFGTGTPPAGLVDLLGDADPDVRLRAALELGESRHDPAAPAIVDRFGRERDFYIRETLTWAALRMPVAALPHVRDALASPRWRCATARRPRCAAMPPTPSAIWVPRTPTTPRPPSPPPSPTLTRPSASRPSTRWANCSCRPRGR
ncbi:MAG: HEAT repeat domain-containing protein [Actinobacteria bacterium]|nr:HEAT repeat domain-containing protein [Actinomycetota bacterium]